MEEPLFGAVNPVTVASAPFLLMMNSPENAP
jgi:hypothetical protein